MNEFILNFVYVRTADSTASDFLAYLFGCCVFYRIGGGDGDSVRGEEFCGKILSIDRC